MEKKPRPHAELIRQWADGESIQYRKDDGMEWTDAPDPAFVADYQYRVKPVREYPQCKMTKAEARLIHDQCEARDFETWAEDVIFTINAGLRHAIDAGQVVTREEFDKVSAELKASRGLYSHMGKQLFETYGIKVKA